MKNYVYFTTSLDGYIADMEETLKLKRGIAQSHYKRINSDI